MVLNTETRDKNGKLVSKDKVSDDEEPSTNHTKKNLSKPKAGKSEYEEKIRVGKDYQVPIPIFLDAHPEEPYDDRALLVWSPAEDDDSKIEEYITLAREKYGYTVEQALGMLFWHKHDLEKAALDLANFTPLRDHWSKEDKILFEQAFQFHGKCFHRIRQMLPDKSIADLVKYYYCWKKTRNRSSVMDRQEERRKEGLPGNGSEQGTPDDSEIEDKKWPIRGIRRTSRSPNRIQSPMLNNADSATNNPPTSSATNSTKLRAQRFGSKQGNENKDTGYSSSSSSSNGISKVSTSPKCQNCTVVCNELKNTSSGNFCASCYNHWRRTGMMRPTQGPYNMGIEVNQRPRSKTNKLYYYQGYHDGSIKYKRKPPKGMWINHDDVRKLAAQDANANETSKGAESNDLLKEVETEIEILLCQIQTNKQKISKLKKVNELFPDNRLSEESSLIRANSRWMKDEVALARLGFVKYGNNPKAIAEMIGTKTESHVKKKLKEPIFLDLHAAKPNNDIKTDIINEIMEIDSDDEHIMNGENHNDDSGKKKIEKLSEVTITPIRKSSKDVPVESST